MSEHIGREQAQTVVPELRIVANVLLVAIQDAAAKGPDASKSRRYRMMTARRKRKAMDWFMSDSTAPWSAAWCASSLGIDLEAMRSEIRKSPAALSRRVAGFQRSKAAA